MRVIVRGSGRWSPDLREDGRARRVARRRHPKVHSQAVEETFDLLPLLTVAPVMLIDADADEKHGEVGATENENDPTWVAIWERSQRNKATIEMRSRTSNRMAPAAYRGPRGVFLQRAFHCSNPWGEENGEQMYMHDMEWERVESSIESRPMKRELARWIRLVRLEEAQQALDIRRYDAHDAVLKYAGSTRTVKARSVSMGVANGRNTMDMTDYMPFDEFGRYDVDVYSLEVPGLIEGYRPWRERCPPTAHRVGRERAAGRQKLFASV